MKKKVEKILDIIYKSEGFDIQLEKVKKKGLELILAVQNFTLEPSNIKMVTVHEKVAEYWIVCKQILRNAPREELKYLVRLNKTFENTMKDLEIKETYSNILLKYETDIQLKLETKIRSLVIDGKPQIKLT